MARVLKGTQAKTGEGKSKGPVDIWLGMEG